MVNGEDEIMVRPWMKLALTMTMALILTSFTGCHKKASEPEVAAAEQPSAEGVAEEQTETGPPASPRPEGPVTYPAGDEPLLIEGAEVLHERRDPGHWEVTCTVDMTRQDAVRFYREEAANRGWTEKSSQPMGAGAFITWETPHGELQVIVAKNAAGKTSVDLNWNQRR